MASFLYGKGALRLIIGNAQTTTIDFPNDTTTIKAALSTSTHAPNKDDEFYDDGGADDLIDGELSGTGYTAGGDTLGATQTVAYDASNDRVELDAPDAAWTGIDAGTAAQATVLKDTGTETTSPVLCNVDTGGFPVVTNGGDLSIAWNAEGIMHLTV
jgi:hypothetical protein